MGGSGVIDNFLGVFTSYIDSGFGLLGGEVAFIATTLIVIDVTLAALFWSWGADDDIIARLVKKTLFVGAFAYIIDNWNNLARIIFESFAGLGLKGSGTGFSTADLLRPGRVAQVGLDAARSLAPVQPSVPALPSAVLHLPQAVRRAWPCGGALRLCPAARPLFVVAQRQRALPRPPTISDRWDRPAPRAWRPVSAVSREEQAPPPFRL